MEQRRTRRMGFTLLLGLAPLAALSACGDDDETIEEQSQEYCESVDELTTDLRSLGDLDASNSKQDIEDLRDEIEDDIEDVRESGEDLSQEQIDELNDAFTAFQQAVDSISDDQSISASLQVLAVDIAQLGDMVREIASAGNCEDGTTTTAG
jgi:hypothetical protein